LGMKILVVGSGGREHAIAWALSRSTHVSDILTTSNNAGILRLARRAPVDPGDLDGIADFAATNGVDLTVIGPEQPLVGGLSDRLLALGLPVFGPISAAARLEGSKVFAKEFMQRNRIPTARFEIANDPQSARRVIDSGAFTFPLVLKADGLAAGKGVIIAEDHVAAYEAIDALMVARSLGDAGARVLIEECLVGRELSYLVLCDGKSHSALPVAQDHKRAYDHDQGPNTGGMGAFSVPGLVDEKVADEIERTIVEPTLIGAEREGFPFRGVLYCGLMLTSSGPQALEYNVRFGDPETQAILRRLESDFAETCLAVSRGELDRSEPKWSHRASTCVVLASEGYPGSSPSGRVITGIDQAEELESVVVFQAGTAPRDGQTVTAGGRVLGVTALGSTLAEATTRAYAAVDRISFEGMHFRHDIGGRF
jgi:phosphoribosylamine--glycine ligase